MSERPGQGGESARGRSAQILADSVVENADAYQRFAEAAAEELVAAAEGENEDVREYVEQAVYGDVDLRSEAVEALVEHVVAVREDTGTHLSQQQRLRLVEQAALTAKRQVLKTPEGDSRRSEVDTGFGDGDA